MWKPEKDEVQRKQKQVQPLVMPAYISFNPQRQMIKVEQANNKSKFFEGQLDPLLKQNTKMKSELTQLHRMMISATQMLRNLLPIPNDPQKKLELQMANLEGISIIIRLDWLQMKEQISKFNTYIQISKSRIQSLQLQYKCTVEKHQDFVKNLVDSHNQLQCSLKSKIAELETSLMSTIQQSKREIEQVKLLTRAKQRQMEQLKRKHNNEIKEEKQKQNELKKLITVLREEISENIKQFEENRKMMIENNIQLMQEKQEEFKRQYEYVLKLRQQQYTACIRELNEELQGVQNKLHAKQQQILQQYELTNKYIMEKQNVMKQYSTLQVQLLNCKDQISRHLQEIENKNKTVIKLQESIQIEVLKNKSLSEVNQLKQKNIEMLNEKIKNNQQAHVIQIEEKENQLKQIGMKINKIQQELQRSQLEIRGYMKNLQDRQKQIDNLIKYRQENLGLKQEMEKCKAETGELNRKMEECLNLLKQKQQILQGIMQQFMQKQKLMKNTHEERLLELQNQYKGQIEKINEENKEKYKNTEDYIKKLQKQQQKKLESMQQKLKRKEQELKQAAEREQIVKKSVQTLIKQNRERIERLEKQREREKALEIEKHKFQLNGLSNKISELHQKQRIEVLQKKKQYQQELNRVLQKHGEQMALKQQKYLQQLTKIQDQKNKKMAEKQLEFAKMIQQKQRQYSKKLQILEENIKVLKTNNGLIEIQNKYNLAMETLRLQSNKQMQELKNRKQKQYELMRDQYEKQILAKTTKFSKDMEQTKNKYDKQIKEIQLKYDQELHEISIKLQSNIVLLNQELISEKQAHQFTKLSRQEKIKYLSDKIAEIKRIFEQKQTKIQQLESLLSEKNIQLQKIDLLVIEKLRKKKEQYDLYVAEVMRQCEQTNLKNNQICNQKIKNAQIQRIAFAESFYKDFQQIKQKNEQEINKYKRMYDELESLFQERPSREEDIKRIKQLSIIKQKMELEVKQFKKKIEGANDIVRYLNLQLQNYKDVYDIFGPQGPDQQVSQIRKEEINKQFREKMKNLVKLTKPTKQLKQPNNLKKLKQKNNRYKTQELENFEKYDQKYMRQSNLDQIQSVQQPQEGQQRFMTIGTQKKLDHAIVRENMKQYRRRKPDKSKSFLQKYNLRSNQKDKQTIIHKIRNQSNFQQSDHKEKQQSFKSNAQKFLSLINSQKPPNQIRRINQGYGKILKKRTESKVEKIGSIDKQQKEKRYKIKDRILIVDNY